MLNRCTRTFVVLMILAMMIFNCTTVYADSSIGNRIAEYASSNEFLGIPYEWAGASKSGFDCSGFTMYVYAQFGYELPHYTGDQKNLGRNISYDSMQPGDLVFFYSDYGHVGIYIGNSNFVHASQEGIAISSLGSGHYLNNFKSARRIVEN